MCIRDSNAPSDETPVRTSTSTSRSAPRRATKERRPATKVHQITQRIRLNHRHTTSHLRTPGQVRYVRNPTTSFLTATTLIYANGAGITAAAGTRLALHWILVKVFKLYSFRLSDPNGPDIVISCHYLPVLGLGNLRACCLPWMW